jgi:hypothetical protein
MFSILSKTLKTRTYKTIFAVVSSKCEKTVSYTNCKRLKKVLKEICGPKTDEVKGQFRIDYYIIIYTGYLDWLGGEIQGTMCWECG